MSEFLLRVQESIRIGRPIDVVRRQFGDVRHHEIRRPHRGVQFTLLTDSGNECRYRHEVRVVGLRQVAEVVLRRDADGSQTNHFVSGPNAGMRVIHRFQADGPDATVAEVTIEMPMRGVRRLLAPVVRRFLHASLVTGLEEDRRDIEERGYPASGSMR
ncbi:MAG TPA: hypothetical protein VKA21_13630 [Candidatus Binatia bacterium]|nr:hypothetical protein [Candidatus Binatia bacterium]